MKGIRRHGRGWQASVYVAGAGRRFEAFPIDTPMSVIEAWRTSTRLRLELEAHERPIAAAGTFGKDAERYLTAVRAMPDYQGRAYDIARWIDAFGERRTLEIKAYEIRAQRDKWLTVGPKRIYDKAVRAFVEKPLPLAASTVNHRMRALENLYTVLYPQGYNPVKQVPEADEPDAADRSLSYDVIEAILAVMPDRGRGIRGRSRSTISKSKARLRLMAYTGLTPAQMMQLRPADLDATLPAMLVARRKKGKGAAGGWRPLPAEAIPAIRAFVEADAFGRFSRDAMRQAWQRACLRLGLPKLRPYDLRHSFAAAVLDKTGDMKATQHLLNHGDERTTARYAQRAIPDWLKAAAAKVTGLRQRIVPE
jgi:integrase